MRRLNSVKTSVVTGAVNKGGGFASPAKGRLECGKNNEIKDNEMAGTIDNGEGLGWMRMNKAASTEGNPVGAVDRVAAMRG